MKDPIPILKFLKLKCVFFFQDESEVVTIDGYHDVPVNDEQSLLKALANQPLSVAIEASGRDFQFYKGVILPFDSLFLRVPFVVTKNVFLENKSLFLDV